jgi:hypothetical protein
MSAILDGGEQLRFEQEVDRDDAVMIRLLIFVEGVGRCWK